MYDLKILKKTVKLQKLNISFASKDEILQMVKSGYLTTYEEILYDHLKRKFFVLRQIHLDKMSYDLLLISPTNGHLWIIEIDGNIHRFERVKERDKLKEELALRKSISLIRIPNWHIGHNLQKVLRQVHNLV